MPKEINHSEWKWEVYEIEAISTQFSFKKNFQVLSFGLK